LQDVEIEKEVAKMLEKGKKSKRERGWNINSLSSMSC